MAVSRECHQFAGSVLAVSICVPVLSRPVRCQAPYTLRARTGRTPDTRI